MLTAESSSSYRNWQPLYAAHNIPTFPVQIDPNRKKPMVSHYGRFGLPGSAEISRKYPDATALGFMAGRRSGLTVLDVDTSDDHVLADALDRHGGTPIIVRSGSGHHQAWYKNNGEKRLIRGFGSDKPIDILGAGVVVAPPSRGIKGDYQFIQGSLDDIDRLPVMRNIAAATVSETLHETLPGGAVDGNRNNTLWRYCMVQAHHCDDLEALLDKASTRNEGYFPPMTDTEVFKIAKSAWGYTVAGQNTFGRGARLAAIEADNIIRSSPDAYMLLKYLRDHNGPQRTFMVANGLHLTFKWTRKRLARTRAYLMDQGHLGMVRGASSRTGAALYQWRNPANTIGGTTPPTALVAGDSTKTRKPSFMDQYMEQERQRERGRRVFSRG